MSERKVINKYYPIDYDPSKLKRIKRPKDKPQQTKVRIALPMSLQCTNCGNFMARGSKFNARKETVHAETYLGNLVFRFYFRCSKCFQELTFKTDPKNSDYVAEHGVKAGYVLHVAGAKADAEETAEKEQLEAFDKMRALEQKALDSLAEVEVNEAIDTVLMIQSQRAQLGVEELHRRALQALDPTIEELLDDDDLNEDELTELATMQHKLSERHRIGGTASAAPLENDDFGDAQIDDEDEDPIAAKSRLARERLLQLQQNQPTDTSTGPNATHASTQDPTPPSTSNAPIAPTDVSTAPAPSNSSNATSLSKGSRLFKAPLAKILTSNASNQNQASVSPQPAPSTPQNAAPALITKKYQRRDDDDE